MSIAKNLDEYDFGKTAPERMNHLSCLILKHSHRLDILRKTYEQHCDDIEETSPDARTSSMKRVMNKFKKEICGGFENAFSECDTMLKLTSQKQATILADSLITKEQKALARLDDTANQFQGKETKKITPIDALIELNSRVKTKVNKPTEQNPTRQPSSNRKRKAPARYSAGSSVLVSPEPEQREHPCTEDDDTHIMIYLCKKKTFCLPKPAATTELGKQYPNQYTLREVVKLPITSLV